MRTTAGFLIAGVFAVVALALPAGIVQLHAQQQSVQAQDQAIFRASVDLVTADVIVRDRRDQFLANLKSGEFEVFEDGVKQDIASLVLIHGGREFSIQAPPSPPVQEGLILPGNRPTNDTAGRIFVLFIDDLHMDFRTTPRTRQLLTDMLKDLIHDGDMFGIVSTGPSSISEQLTYNRQVLESAIGRVANGGLTPKEIIQGTQSSQGPTELRHRANVAFETAYKLVKNLEQVQHRRKAVIYISSGYDFNPFEKSRLEEQARRWNVENVEDLANDPFIRQQQSSQALAESDLIARLAELTRAANRANASFYPIDPRGLVAGPDMDEDGINAQDWNEHVRETQSSLRVLAEQTGGFAIVNQNDFAKGLKRIDNETSDYYVIGYYSKNPDPLKRRRAIEIKVTRDGARVTHSRTAYTLRPR